MKTKIFALLFAVMLALGVASSASAATFGGPPNPSGQCPTGNTPGCSPHR
jgi:hypothetical protein